MKILLLLLPLLFVGCVTGTSTAARNARLTAEANASLAKPGVIRGDNWDMDLAAAQRRNENRYEDEAGKHAAEAKQRRESFVTAHPNVPAEINAAILEGRIRTGMTPDQVEASWGSVHSTNTSGGVGVEWVTWSYNLGDGRSDTLFFADGKLVRWNFDR